MVDAAERARPRPIPPSRTASPAPACVIHVAIAPNYPAIGVAGYRLHRRLPSGWRNAFDFAAAACIANSSDASGPDPFGDPDAVAVGIALTILLVGAGAASRRRRCAPQR